MAWPNGSKASTTNVDQGSDKIRLARPDIKQNIDNVNAIIDTFNIGTPNDGDILQYNSTTSQFDTVSGYGAGHTVALRFNSVLSHGLTNSQYGGGFTIVGNNSTGISANQDSAGESQIIFPAGTYVIEIVADAYSGVFGATRYDLVTTTWRDESDNSTLWRGTTKTTGFYFRVYTIGTTLTFATDTTVNVLATTDIYADQDFEHPDVIITRLA